MPLLAALFAGLLGHAVGKRVTHWVNVSLIAVSFLVCSYVFKAVVLEGQPSVEGVIYTWINNNAFLFDIALLIDKLSATMICVVTFVSLMVHIYTIGYMADDDGYQRFFCYVSL